MIPDWLNGKLIEEYLQRHYQNPGLKVISFEATLIAANGESAFSMIYRANVAVNTQSEWKSQTSTQNLIIKVAFPDEQTIDVTSQCRMYDKEIEFYGNIVGKFNQKLRELGEPQLIAECFGVCKARRMLILEDLSTKGYDVLPVQRGYSIAEAKIILKRLATYHAICAVLQEDQSDIFDRIKSGGHFGRDMSTYNEIYFGNLDAAIEVISAWPEYGNYAEKLRKIRNELVERVEKNYEIKPHHFSTLNHDDPWCPNFMLKLTDDNNLAMDEERPAFDNMILIDFQFVYWASPATDLHFFLASSIDESLRPYHFYELVQYYHEQLSADLRRLDYKQYIPDWEDFEAQYQERCFTAFIVSCLMLPNLAHNVDQLCLEQLVQNDENGINLKRKMFQQEKVQAILRKMIPYFDRMGIFD